jgi:hypothetical protein
MEKAKDLTPMSSVCDALDADEESSAAQAIHVMI